MRFLLENEGDVALEYVIVGAIVAVVLGAALVAVTQSASGKAGEIGTWIANMTLPSGP